MTKEEEKEFEIWWDTEGRRRYPTYDNPGVEAICKIAWSNGLYKGKKDD